MFCAFLNSANYKIIIAIQRLSNIMGIKHRCIILWLFLASIYCFDTQQEASKAQPVYMSHVCRVLVSDCWH